MTVLVVSHSLQCLVLSVFKFKPFYWVICDPMNCSSPGSSVHGILQVRILEWVAIPFSSESSQPRGWTQVSCTAGRLFTISGTKGITKWHQESLLPVLTEAIKKFKHSCLQDKHSAQLQGLAEGLLQPPLLPPDRQSAWWTMDGGLWHCTGDRDQDHPHGKEMQKSKMAVWGGLTNSYEKKRSEKQRRKGKI